MGGENIPFADESPERPMIVTRPKPVLRPVLNYVALNNDSGVSSGGGGGALVSPSSKTDDSKEQCSSPASISSDDTDTSTTSNPRDKLSASTIRIEQLREMSRMLSNLEKKAHHLERKFSLNRSLSLNYKNHKNYECCCGGGGGVGRCSNNNNNNNTSVRSRLSLTKDEKTDKNISKRRQLQDSVAGNKRRTGAKDRSIRRRHTVGGAHDYKGGLAMNDCGGGGAYIVATDISSNNTLKVEDEEEPSSSATPPSDEYSRK